MNLDQTPAPAPPSGQPVWLISFADLISLLLCFFVMLFAMSSIELARWKSTMLVMGKPAVESAPFTQSDASEPWQRRAGRVIAGAVGDNGTDLDYLAALLQRRIDEGSELDGVVLTRFDDHLVVSLASDSLFEIGRTTVNPNSRLMLATLGRVLANMKNQVDVRGHGEPPSAARSLGISPIDNWQISLARAASVADELQQGGFLRAPMLVGLSDSRFAEWSASVPESDIGRLARRVDIIVRAWKSDQRG